MASLRLRRFTQILWCRNLWLRFIMNLHDYSPRLIADGPWSNLFLYQACPALSSDSNIINCKVTTLIHYKEKHSPYHEFLLAVVCIDCGGVPCTISMRIERLVKDEDLSKLSSSSTRAPPQDIISISGRSGHDFVSRVACEIVETVTFTSLPLYDFCRLLCLVTDVGRFYHILKYQCYWFCWIIKKASKDLWGGSPAAGPAKHLDGRFAGSPSKIGRDSESLRELLELYRALPPRPDGWVNAGRAGRVRQRELQEALERERTTAQDALERERTTAREALERERTMTQQALEREQALQEARERERAAFEAKIESLQAQLAKQ